ncbi:hypothetical protein CC86DRAFT_424688 [Ophiobolus disseminans]|uniref:Uncharacterized protein n=1 Tax=Ophiobolus disseminans TaxID=1469910 RepID=A0A6A7AGB2_9PLEO|nr:hypothetical protein CC86DRAFT_424688 [Ophiobolus disseminans]
MTDDSDSRAKCATCSDDILQQEVPNRRLADTQEVCKDIHLEMILVRTADIVQRAFLKFRERTWDPDAVKIKLEGSDIVVHDNAVATDQVLFRSFPDHLVSDPSVKAGMLCAFTCQEPFVYMRELFKQLTQGKVVPCFALLLISNSVGHDMKIQEVGIQLKPVPRMITTVYLDHVMENWPRNIHEVLRVTSLTTGKAWYIDISGPQYNINCALWPAMEFTRAHIDQIVHVLLEGANQNVFIEAGQRPEIKGLITRKLFEAAGHINAAIGTWVKTEKLELQELVKLDAAAFDAKKESLLNTMKEAVGDFILDSDFRPEIYAIFIAGIDKGKGPLTAAQKAPLICNGLGLVQSYFSMSWNSLYSECSAVLPLSTHCHIIEQLKHGEEKLHIVVWL